MKTVLVTGANRGVGLEITRQLLARGGRVFGGCRQPEEAEALQEMAAIHRGQLTVLRLDVTDDETVTGAKTAVSQQTDHLDWLINNAGILVRGENLDNFDSAIMTRTLDVNVTGPMRVTAVFADLLRKGSESKIINVSSQLGSLERAKAGGLYSYNASKAALNMVTRMMAHDLRPSNIAVIAIHPGWVQTDMGGSHAAVTVPDSAAGIIRVADDLTMADTNKFYIYNGGEHPW